MPSRCKIWSAVAEWNVRCIKLAALAFLWLLQHGASCWNFHCGHTSITVPEKKEQYLCKLDFCLTVNHQLVKVIQMNHAPDDGQGLPETCWANLIDQQIIVASSWFICIILSSISVLNQGLRYEGLRAMEVKLHTLLTWVLSEMRDHVHASFRLSPGKQIVVSLDRGPGGY